jgi:hypothetical protein
MGDSSTVPIHPGEGFWINPFGLENGAGSLAAYFSAAGRGRRVSHSSRFSLRGPNTGLYDIGIDHALSIPIERPQSRDARELDRAATFGRARYQLRCCEDDRRAAFE